MCSITSAPADIDVGGFSLNPAELTKLLQEHRQERLASLLGKVQKDRNTWHLARPHHHRPRRSAAKPRDELASSHPSLRSSEGRLAPFQLSGSALRTAA